jgi:chorismate mutase
MSDRLSALRSEIDLIDDQILQLILSRLQVCEAIFQVKQTENLEIRDEAREKQLIARLQAQVTNHQHQAIIESIFKEISKGCLSYQKSMAQNQETQSRN